MLVVAFNVIFDEFGKIPATGIRPDMGMPRCSGVSVAFDLQYRLIHVETFSVSGFF